MKTSYSIDRHKTAIWRVKGTEVHSATRYLQWWDESILTPEAIEESIGNYWHRISRREARKLFPELFRTRK